MNEKKLRAIVFAIAAVLHLLIILFLAFDIQRYTAKEDEDARIMKLTDLAEIPPPPAEKEIPMVEEIAEAMVETDIPPIQNVVAAGTIITQQTQEEDDYLPMHLLSTPPHFDENTIASALVYPPIALRSGLEGRVLLELFVDRTGAVQRIIILREEPQGRGFGESAVRAFTGKKGTPATANGVAVPARYRYPVTFRIR